MKIYRPPSKDILAERKSPELIRLGNFLELYNLSTTVFYKEVKKGTLKLTKIGRCSYIKRADAEAWLITL